MVQYTNSTPNFNDWNFYFQPFPYSEGLVVLLILLCRLKIQLQKPNCRRNIKLIQEFQRRVVHLLNTLMNWCARMQDFDDNHIKKNVINVKVVPYENKTIVKPEKKKEDKHPCCSRNHIGAKTSCLSCQMGCSSPGSTDGRTVSNHTPCHRGNH